MLRHNWVSVSDMGAFVCEHKSAYFDVASNVWYPPCRRIRFIFGKFPEDNILLKSVIRKHDVKVMQAKELINNFATNTISEINSTGKCEYPEFGIFYKSDSGNIIFKSVHSPEQNNYESGLETVDLNVLSNIGKSNKDPEVSSMITEPKELKKLDFEKNYYLPINKIFVKSVACIMLIIGLAWSFVVPTEITPLQNKTIIITKVSDDNNIKKNHKEDIINESGNESSVKKDSSDRSDCIPEEYQYHLIVGTFHNKKEALKYISMNEHRDYKLTLLPTKTLYRVACASSDHKESLLQELNSSKFKTNYKEAWIWNAGQSTQK